MKPIEEDLKNFEIELKLAEKKERTIKQYSNYINEFINFANINNKEDITKEVLINYKEQLKKQHKDKINSINIKIIIINKFVDFLGYDKTYKLKQEKQQQQLTLDNVLTLKEYQHLREYAKATKQDRLYYLMGTLANTGVRVSELEYITAEAVRQGHVTIENKGKSRDVLLDGIIDDLKKELLTYCNEEHIKEGVIFKSRRGTPLDNAYIWRQLQKLARAS